MKGSAWTVFQCTEPEPVPVEIIVIVANMWGPHQDIIVGKLTGKAARTNVAGGMSGSPVYIDGKLVGAISLRLSVFSPDAICGITPIGLMLEVNEFDKSRPSDSKTPDRIQRASAGSPIPSDLLKRVLEAAPGTNVSSSSMMTTIATPITTSVVTDGAVSEFSPIFNQLGLTG